MSGRPFRTPRTIVFAAYDGMQLQDLSGPLDTFALCNELQGGRPAYELHVISAHGGAVRTSSGLTIDSERISDLSQSEVDTLIVPGAAALLQPDADAAGLNAWLHIRAPLVQWIARRGEQVRRLCSVSTGAFLLGAAGWLRGRSVVTHWAAAKLLSASFANVTVFPDRIFVHDGLVWSSGGITAGIDLALALIESDFGSELALAVARYLVVFLKRAGEQSQISEALAAQISEDRTFASLHAWIRENISRDLRVEDLATRAGMSRRTFMRTYTAITGRTPGSALQAMRLEAARLALETGSKSLKVVARQSGLKSSDRLRRLFQQSYGVTPADYRKRFSGRA